MDIAGYFKVRIQTLIADKPLSFDLHLRINNQVILYLRAGDKLEKAKIDALKSRDSGNHFLVKDADRVAFRDYLHNQMSSTELNVAEKALVLRESSMGIVEDLYENPDVGVALENAKPVVNEFITFMQAEPEAMSHLISLSGHDFYTYSHSLDVSIYSLGLADAVGFKKNELEEMGLAALFHDIGKRNISLDILCKKGGLDDAEWTQMQKHPQYGIAILNDYPNVTDAVKAACFEHHESFAGNGYPQQLTGPEIHPFARIVAITDTYDAMTTQRSYNVPMKPVDAVNMMREKLAARYDPDMLKALYSILFKLKAA